MQATLAVAAVVFGGDLRHAGILEACSMSAQRGRPDHPGFGPRHRRSQGASADRLPDGLHNTYGGDSRRALRSFVGRRFRRHGPARSSQHRRRHVGDDDPARPGGDARLPRRAMVVIDMPFGS